MNNKIIKSKKIILILILLVFVFPTISLAETKAGLTPNNTFYFLDTFFEKIDLFFTLNKEKRTQKIINNAEERLEEAKQMISKNESEIVNNLIKNYKKNIKKAKNEAVKIKNKEKSKEVLSFLEEKINIDKKLVEEKVLNKDVSEKTRENILVNIDFSSLLDKQEEKINISLEKDEEPNKEIKELREEISQLKKEVKENKKTINPVVEKKELKTFTLPNGSIIDEEGTFIYKAPEIQEKSTIQTVNYQNNYQVEPVSKQTYKNDCLETHYTRAQIQKVVDQSVSNLENSYDGYKQGVISRFKTKIDDIKSEGEKKINSKREAQRGFGTNNALLNQIQDEIDEDVKDYEDIRDNSLAQYDINLSLEISDIRMRQLELEKESVESICY